jgi:hypothetical protein
MYNAADRHPCPHIRRKSRILSYRDIYGDMWFCKVHLPLVLGISIARILLSYTSLLGRWMHYFLTEYDLTILPISNGTLESPYLAVQVILKCIFPDDLTRVLLPKIILYRTRADDHIAQQNLPAVLRSLGNSTADTYHQA